ncbi:cytochrome P450 [Daldinia bambusicola]|nr:cytochrome P450 [Daldinia bambusicola]
MSYIAAVIEETLRLHPPAATARTTTHSIGFTVRTPEGQEHSLDGTIIYNCETLIHRDPDVYGDTANSFVPESAWRPFERGPRNCIGQEFANIELRIFIAVVARRYDFFKVVAIKDGWLEVKSELFNTRQITIKPVDGMRMKVRIAW